MTVALVYDVETTGIPGFSARSDAPHQPHIIEIAASLVNIGSREVVGGMSAFVCDSGPIPPEITELTGITTTTAEFFGIPCRDALSMFVSLWTRSQVRIAHNETFDARIIRIALKRMDYSDTADTWSASNSECTARMATPICKLPATDAMKAKTSFKYKTPTLAEAYQHLIGKPMQGAHRAATDVAACIEIYFAIEDRQ